MCRSKIQENAPGKQCEMAFHMSQTHRPTLFHIFFLMNLLRESRQNASWIYSWVLNLKMSREWAVAWIERKWNAQFELSVFSFRDNGPKWKVVGSSEHTHIRRTNTHMLRLERHLCGWHKVIIIIIISRLQRFFTCSPPPGQQWKKISVRPTAYQPCSLNDIKLAELPHNQLRASNGGNGLGQAQTFSHQWQTLQRH